MSDKTLYSTHYDNDKCRTYGSYQIIHTTHALFYHVRPNSRCRHFDEIVVTAWLHWKLSKCQASVQPIMKVSSKMTDFRFCFWLISSNNPNWGWGDILLNAELRNNVGLMRVFCEYFREEDCDIPRVCCILKESMNLLILCSSYHSFTNIKISSQWLLYLTPAIDGCRWRSSSLGVYLFPFFNQLMCFCSWHVLSIVCQGKPQVFVLI